MKSMLKAFKEYLSETPRDIILSDWNKAKKESPKNSPTLKQFLYENKNRTNTGNKR